MQNRKLLISVQSQQEAREALGGGARIIDSEDPRTALGNIAPERIIDISQAVLQAKRNLDVQLSTSIGEDQLLFRRSRLGRALIKSDDEMAGKAAQAALGVATAMGTTVHPSAIVKIGVDGMSADDARNVIATSVSSLRRNENLRNTSVMAVFFVHDLDAWDAHKNNKQNSRRRSNPAPSLRPNPAAKTTCVFTHSKPAQPSAKAHTTSGTSSCCSTKSA